MCKLVQYVKLLFDVNAVILFMFAKCYFLYVLAFAHHFACTWVRIHILSFNNIDTFYYLVVLNKILFCSC